MGNDSPKQRESLWRRKLSEAERAALRGRPDLELEARLTDALVQLPDAPVPSNFTARVMNAVELEDRRPEPARGWRWNWHVLLPRVAFAAALLLVAGVGIQRYEVARSRSEMARSLSVVASAQSVPSVEALENLDAIQRMSQSGRADTELLAALQ